MTKKEEELNLLITDKLNLFFYEHKNKITHCVYFLLHALQIFLIIKLSK